MELPEALKESLEKLDKKLGELPAEIVRQLREQPLAAPPQEPPKPAPEPPPEELAKQLREQMFWIYGVLVGFSLRQVMVDILPRVLPAWFVNPPQAVAPWSDIWWLEFLRLIVFLMMITRFYLGSVVFFKNAAREHKRDVFLGYLHFLVFFAWSLTLKSHDVGWWGLSAYLLTLGIVLLFDYGYRLSPSWTEDTPIRVWAARNLSTVVCSLVPALIFVYHYHASEWHVELVPLILVSCVTALDFYEMFVKIPPKFPRSLLRFFP